MESGTRHGSDGCNGTNQWGPTPADNLKKLLTRWATRASVSDALHGSKANRSSCRLFPNQHNQVWSLTQVASSLANL